MVVATDQFRDLRLDRPGAKCVPDQVSRNDGKLFHDAHHAFSVVA